MATTSEVYASLRVIGASCKGMGSGDNWAMELAQVWASELGNANGQDVMEAARRWIRSEDRRPSLAQFIVVVKAARGSAVANDRKLGCADCGESGWRHIVVHWMDSRANKRRVNEYTAPCECELGLYYATSNDGFTFSKAIRQYKNKPGFIELHCTDRDRLALPFRS